MLKYIFWQITAHWDQTLLLRFNYAMKMHPKNMFESKQPHKVIHQINKPQNTDESFCRTEFPNFQYKLLFAINNSPLITHNYQTNWE